jgi:hypothetical protein
VNKGEIVALGNECIVLLLEVFSFDVVLAPEYFSDFVTNVFELWSTFNQAKNLDSLSAKTG